jgi:hypothetical protein
MTSRQKVASTSQPSSVPICAPHYNMQIRDVTCSVYVRVSEHFSKMLVLSGVFNTTILDAPNYENQDYVCHL